jgi:DUF4097 and DUF4098 domain-containing protein YvlB
MTKSVKVWICLAVALILVGSIAFGGVMSMLKWDFRKLGTKVYETNIHEITESFDDISVDVTTADIKFELSADGKCKVECYEAQNEKHAVIVSDNILKITVEEKVSFLNNFGINFDTPKIKIYLPKSEYSALNLKLTTGDVDIKSFNFKLAKIKITTGDVSLEDVKVYEQLSVKATTGDCDLQMCDAKDISIKATTGDVTGVLLSGKEFNCKVTTGDIEVPQSTTGGKCEIRVTTGDIKIEIAK